MGSDIFSCALRISKYPCREILDCIRITASGINKLDWRIASTVIQSGKSEEWVAQALQHEKTHFLL
jgi:hypothetical protein